MVGEDSFSRDFQIKSLFKNVLYVLFYFRKTELLSDLCHHDIP